MIDHRICLSSAVVLSASLLAPGCSSKDGGDSAALGRAQAAVTNVPSDGSVACIAITSTGSWASTQSFDVTPGESTVFTLDGIPTGTVRFDGSAYPTACALVTASSVPTWVSTPVLATVTEGQTTMVSLELQQAGNGTVGVGFMPSPTCRSAGLPCLSGGECCSGTCGADDTCAPAGTCAAGQTMCGAACTDLGSDPNNCGACGNACPAGDACTAGACVASGDGGTGGTGPTGGVGPTISCASPVDGATLGMSPGSMLSFQGAVQSSNGGVQVTVNGVPVALSGSMFSASIPTRFGVNFADIVATDKSGAQSAATCSFLVADQWAPEAAGYADTIDLELMQTAIDDGVRGGPVSSFADMLYDVANGTGLAQSISTALAAANPLKPEGCDSQTCFGPTCICSYSSGIEYMGLSVPGPETVDLTLVNGGLWAHAHLPNVGVSLHVHGDVNGVPYDTTGLVTMSSIDVMMTFDVTLSGGRPHAAIRAGTVSTSITGIGTSFSGLDSWINDNVVMPLAQGQLKSAVSSQVASYLQNDFSSVLDGTLSGVGVSTLGTSFDVQRLDGTGNIPLSFGIGFSSLSTTSSSMLVGISSTFTGPTGQSLPSLGIAIPPGTVLDRPTVSAPSSAAAAIHVGVFNQAMHALWRAGMFDATLSGTQLGGGLPAAAGAQITTALPPVAAINGSSVEISLGALQASVTYPGLFGGVDAGGKPLPPLSVELGARATATPTLAGNALQFGNLTITELHFSTGSASLDAKTNQVITTLLQQIVQRFVDQSLNASLLALPIPSCQLPASISQLIVTAGPLGLSGPSLGFDTNDFVLRGPLGVK